eukprot:g7500.t1
MNPSSVLDWEDERYRSSGWSRGERLARDRVGSGFLSVRHRGDRTVEGTTVVVRTRGIDCLEIQGECRLGFSPRLISLFVLAATAGFIPSLTNPRRTVLHAMASLSPPPLDPTSVSPYLVPPDLAVHLASAARAELASSASVPSTILTPPFCTTLSPIILAALGSYTPSSFHTYPVLMRAAGISSDDWNFLVCHYCRDFSLRRISLTSSYPLRDNRGVLSRPSDCVDLLFGQWHHLLPPLPISIPISSNASCSIHPSNRLITLLIAAMRASEIPLRACQRCLTDALAIYSLCPKCSAETTHLQSANGSLSPVQPARYEHDYAPWMLQNYGFIIPPAPDILPPEPVQLPATDDSRTSRTEQVGLLQGHVQDTGSFSSSAPWQTSSPEAQSPPPALAIAPPLTSLLLPAVISFPV